MNLLTIKNNGPEIVETNYFESEYAKNGYFYLSTNSGTFRLLVPPLQGESIKEIKTGKIAVASIGHDVRCGGREMVELMFDDGRDDPYCLNLSMEQLDRKPEAADDLKELLLIVYSSGLKKEFEIKCGFRYVNKLPCMKPWISNGTN